MIERTLNRCADFAAISGVNSRRFSRTFVSRRQFSPILSHGLNIRCRFEDLFHRSLICSADRNVLPFR